MLCARTDDPSSPASNIPLDTKKSLDRLLLTVLVAAQCGAARAQEIVAVLGSQQRAHQETFESFSAAFGRTVPVLPLGEAIPADARIVLAFGGKAAVQRYPGRVTLIYAIAPGLVVDRRTHPGRSVKIMMEPEAGVLLGRLHAIQPKLKRLAVLWSNDSLAARMERLVQMGEARGVSVTAERLVDEGDLPARLRELVGKIDALWLTPDPLLINARNFDILKRFSYDNDIPFYVPTEGLVAQGGTAAVFASNEEMGRTMAAAAKAALAGAVVPAESYPARILVSLNRAAAAEAALTISSEALGPGDTILP